MANPNKDLLKAAKRNDIEAAKKALEMGADLEAKTGFWGNTALAAAAAKGHADVMKFLIEKGAQLNALNSIGDTPLHNAVSSNVPAAAELLLEKGALTNIRNQSRRTPLEHALEYKYMAMAEAIRLHETKRLLEAAAQKAKEDQERAAAAAETAARLRREQEEKARRESKEYTDVVIFTQRIGDLVLEDAFNFAALERLTFVRKGPGGDVQSMTRQSFQEVDNKKLLRQAFDEHVKRGGTTPECDVFENCDKPRIKAPGGPQ